ncbi:hypothetical protein N8D56_22820 [Devosia sp. A8/3-2]|nr:hypothetical protein N8D56_22820 [Devosia sp. A8/3-2]
MAQSTGAPPTTLYQFNTASNPFVFNPLGSTAGHAYNAIAMNPVDNYIYGMSTNGTQTVLLRIGSDGQGVNLGVVSGGGINANLTPWHVYNNGEIAPDGSYYVMSSAVNTSTLFRINLATLTATAIPLSQAPITADIARHNGLLYGRRDASGQLYSINPSTGAVVPVGSSSNPPVGELLAP